MLPPLILMLMLEPTGATSAFELGLTGDLVVSRGQDRTQGFVSDASFLAGTSELALDIFYSKPLIDDDGPMILAPFRQRVPAIRVSAHLNESAGGWSSMGQSTSHTTQGERGLTFSATGYIGDLFYVAGSVGVSSFSARDDLGNQVPAPGETVPSTTTRQQARLPLSASLGLRSQHVLYWVGWQVPYTSSNGGPFTVESWWNTIAGISAAPGNHLWILADGGLQHGSSYLRASVEYFFVRNLGVWVRSVINDSLSSSAQEYFGLGGELGVGWWLTPQFEIVVSYAPTWFEFSPPTDRRDLLHDLGLSVVFRQQGSKRSKPD